jgi:hypothetical protein
VRLGSPAARFDPDEQRRPTPPDSDDVVGGYLSCVTHRRTDLVSSVRLVGCLACPLMHVTGLGLVTP